MPAIDKPGQKNDWMSVPQFGGWDQKAGGATDYSMVFSRARANKKQQKTEVTSPGDEREYLAHALGRPLASHHAHQYGHQAQYANAHVHSPMKKKRLLSYFSCCGGA